MGQFRLPADELDYAVLAEMWRLGTASVRDLHGRPGAPKGLVYTTTAKVVDRLREKDPIGRQRKGNAFVYQPREWLLFMLVVSLGGLARPLLALTS